MNPHQKTFPFVKLMITVSSKIEIRISVIAVIISKNVQKNEYFSSYCVFVPLVAFPTLPSTTPQLVFYCLSTLGVNDGGHLSKVFLCYFATVEHCFFSVPSCCTIPFDLDAFRSFSSTTRERSGKKANASFFQPDEQWQRPPIVTPFLVAP